jgi:hypothetical protein
MIQYCIICKMSKDHLEKWIKMGNRQGDLCNFGFGELQQITICKTCGVMRVKS